MTEKQMNVLVNMIINTAEEVIGETLTDDNQVAEFWVRLSATAQNRLISHCLEVKDRKQDN